MRATFFALSALPFYASAQHPVPDAAPAASESTSTSQAFIPPVINTSEEVPVKLQPTSSDAIVVPDTGPAPVVDTTTSPVSVVGISTDSTHVIDTTRPIVQGTTTGPSPVVDTTTGTTHVINTTQPVAEDTTTESLVQGTTTGQPPVIDASTGSAPVIDTTQPIVQDTTTQPIVQGTTTRQPMTTELKPPDVDTTAWLPVGNTSNQPINQTPSSQTSSTEPINHDTTSKPQPPVDSTTTGVPPVETTTQQTSVQDTTTFAGQPVKTTEDSKPSTKDDEPATTQPPTTAAAAAATASVSSVSSQVAALIPIINKWIEDPESLTDETNNKVDDTHDDIIAVIVGLGGKPGIACNKKRRLGMRRLKRRGLLGPIGDVINKLACMAQDLTKISSNIIAGNVPAVTSVIPEVKSQNDDLTEEEENKSRESKESTTERPTSTEESTTTEATTTEATTTEATTTTSSETIVCASGSCGGGSCPVGLGSDGSMPKRMHSIPRDIKCQDIPTTTIDGPLPTGPISLDGSKRDEGLKARMFFDGDITPNPDYIDSVSMNPETIWDDQSGLTTGHFVGAPLDDGWSAAGVNGIYGCTAVLIVSNLGVYTSHIWEVPGFLDRVDYKPTSDDFFKTNVFEVLRDGTLDATTATGISTLIGTESAPGPLHSQFEPHVFVVTPFNTNQSPENPSLFRYEARADQLANQVTGIIPGAISGGVHGYLPIGQVESTGRGEQDPTKLQALGRWRFWVEENLWATHSFNVYDDFFDYAGAEVGTPSNRNQKRADDDAVHKCLLVLLLQTRPPLQIPLPQRRALLHSTTDAETTETVGTTTTEDKTAEATTTQSDTSLPTSTPSTLVTTTRASSNAVTSGVTSDASTTSEEARTYYPCVVYAGPRVSKPYCQCSTTVSGEQYVTTASMIDNSCVDYTTFPSPVVLVTDGPLTQAPIETPFTTTKAGTVLVYSAYTLEYFNLNGFQVTATGGYGVPSTVSTPLPSQTAVDNDGGGECGTSDSLSKDGFGDACDRAINGFDDNTVYTGYTSRYSRLTKGILMFASVGQAACVAKFECDDYGIGMKGSDIIAAREKAKEDDGIWICGHIHLSNSCSIIMDYCTNCKSTG
ncbi:meiotically up-regulated gene family-domain-containing protein [Fusarium tricinctum]|uniref:Meiotically up-regulated gene family-domain-containing protein n=1 Tax=Fusarium tricinctum TaxID=61284 RepID=A0A8K0S445_9HYPO|nr:meiotically up-regulated gene family-domain-containing protein [Fusarium tricinctum]